MKESVEKISPAKPFYYIALVLKGTEQQYLDLLSYIERRNRAQIIYQCKSLTYLYITQENPRTFKTVPQAASSEISHGKRLRGKRLE